MQYLTKSFLVAAVFATLAAAAQADDQQLTNRLIIQNQQSEAAQRATSVAVYAGNGGAVGNRDPHAPQEAGATYELRPNGHGQATPLYWQAPLQ